MHLGGTLAPATGSGSPITASIFPVAGGNALNLSNSGGTYTVAGATHEVGSWVDFNSTGTASGTLTFPIPIDYSFTLNTTDTVDPTLYWSFTFEVTDDGTQYFSSVSGDNGLNSVSTTTTSTVMSPVGASLSVDCPAPSPGAPTCNPTPTVNLSPGATWSTDLQFTAAQNEGPPASAVPFTFSVTDPFYVNFLTPPPTSTAEPATLVLLSFGLGALYFGRRRLLWSKGASDE